MSPKCKFNGRCKKQLCGYRHETIEASTIQDSPESVSVDNNDSEDKQNEEIWMNKGKSHEKARSLYCENYCNIKKNIHILKNQVIITWVLI